ncbi:chemotaxis protein methyltransferase CheR [Roseomonas rosea]|uniref:Chemotaxis protein methyltransferase CheR n=1 Tax=Muricoccus roseus TaxID=198092 RepID=A0A1M6M2B6_9PROT|nr:CheR family methyltransferase [Roseomonas rosea]SHJ77579.1 chemotaxis protein methyltransferase CheR [Roseomonas rosea]
MPAMRALCPPAPRERAEAGLATLAGLAPSEVLRRRLDRAAPLVRALDSPPGLDSPGWAALLDAVTVQETRLFRAAPQLLLLAAMMPDLPGQPARLLSAGCATGEEAWSLSVLAAEAGIEAEVVGLDLCRPALAQARTGRFPAGPPDALREVPASLHARFGQDAGWVVPRAPAPLFRRANLLELPADLGTFGAILCRNVLIYLLPEAREAVLRDLVTRLRPGGALLLGPTDLPPSDLPLAPEPGAHAVWRRL